MEAALEVELRVDAAGTDLLEDRVNLWNAVLVFIGDVIQPFIVEDHPGLQGFCFPQTGHWSFRQSPLQG